MESHSTGYNNAAYCNESYNETFLDDETCFQNYIDENDRVQSAFEQRLRLDNAIEKGARRRLSESFSVSDCSRTKMYDYLPTSNNNRSRLSESFSISKNCRHEMDESFTLSDCSRNNLNEFFSNNNDHKSRLNESFSAGNVPRHRYESVSTHNTPKKSSRRERSSSAPGRRSTMEVFAPMVAQCQGTPNIRRSRSTVRLPRDSSALSPTIQRRPSRSVLTTQPRPMVPNVVAIRPERLHSFDIYCEQGVAETSSLSSELKRRVTPMRKPSSNLAVIPPNCRNINKSAVPLLANSPTKFQTCEFGDRSPTKASWLHLPQNKKPESLWLAGMILLITGFAICVLCFFLLSKKRRSQSFFLELGAVSGFVSFVLGFLGFRYNSYRGEWLPNRNYMSGFIILILLNLLQCGVLGLLSTGWRDIGSPEEDIASGAIGGLAVLTLLLSLFGLGASMCCKNPPPDNRVAHCAQGFIV